MLEMMKLTETFLTDRALEQSLSIVDSHVSLQTPRMRKNFLTDRTLEALQNDNENMVLCSSVKFHVILQGTT